MSMAGIRKKSISPFITILLGVSIIVLRIRKMIHLTMIDELPTILDWLMLILWMFILGLTIWRLSLAQAKTTNESF